VAKNYIVRSRSRFLRSRLAVTIGSELERLFENAWQVMRLERGLTVREPEREYRFDGVRRWRFDFAWLDERLAVECDGGQWLARGGKHARDHDREKLNAAAVQGWRVLRYSREMLERDPGGVMEQVLEALGWKHETRKKHEMKHEGHEGNTK
jgi:very-short-patch-repair endonuclease